MGIPSPIANSVTREAFLQQLVGHLGRFNETVVGSEASGAYIMNVGLAMGEAIETDYRKRIGNDRPLTVEEFAEIIVNLKREIEGEFHLVSTAPDKVVVRATKCPFNTLVTSWPSMCQLSTSVFGGIAARNFGYGKVVLHRRIALGDPSCLITIYLQKSAEAATAVGQEFYPNSERAEPPLADGLAMMDRLSKLRADLAQADSRWEQIVHGASEGICVVNATGAITFANERWRGLFGFTPREMIGSTLSSFVHPKERSRLEEAYANAMTGERVTDLRFRLGHRDGHWCQVVASAGPLWTFRGRVAGSIWTLFDETEQREAKRIKDELIPLVSHELRTPITTIKLAVELLRRITTTEPENHTEVYRKLAMIERQADRLGDLVRDFVDLSRMDGEAFSLKIEEQNIAEFLDQCIERCIRRCPDADRARIRCQHADAMLRVPFDRGRIEQVLVNLLENAIKYSPTGADVVVRTELDEDWVRVHVIDQGIGIPEFDHGRVFDPFYRGSNVSPNHFEGLGLGLHLCHQIALAHRGTLTFVSEPKKGSTFTLSLRRSGVDA